MSRRRSIPGRIALRATATGALGSTGDGARQPVPDPRQGRGPLVTDPGPARRLTVLGGGR